jgi:hypothetical protein
MRNWYVLHRVSKSLSPAATAFEMFMRAEAPGYMKTLLPK